MLPPMLPELERLIVVEHIDSDAALKSCSLVCSRFSYWAQSRLFQRIVIDDCFTKDEAGGGFPNPSVDRVRRLAAILASSTHLSLFVHCLRVLKSTTDVLVALAAISLPNLHTLKLRGIPRTDDWRVLDSFQKLVSGPSLRTLQVAFGRPSKDPTPFETFAALFPPTLTSLDLRLWRETQHTTGASLPPRVDGLSHPPSIRRLGLDRSPAAVALFSDLACPIDLSNVRHLFYNDSVHPALNSLLRRLGRTVDSIALDFGGRTDNSLDFQMFPGLTHIESGFGEEFITNVLERLPAVNHVRSLHVRTSHFQWQVPALTSNMRQLCVNFEATVLRRLPHLQAVEMEVVIIPPLRQLNDFPLFDRTAVVGAIRHSMPRLSLKLLLSISFVRAKIFAALE